MEATTQRPILVLGGTGNTGRRVAQRLQGRGLPVRIGTPLRHPTLRLDRSGQLAGGAGRRGLGVCDLLPGPGRPRRRRGGGHPGRPGRGPRGPAAGAAVGPGRGGRPGRRAGLVQSGADWTIVRSAFMAQNFTESYFLEPVRAGEVAFPAAPDLAEPFIDADDIADVAVAALTDDAHVGQVYEVTDPRLVGWAQAVAEIARAAGRPIRYLPMSLEQYGSLLLDNQVPADHVRMLTGVFAEVLDGRNAWLGDGVQRALGREPRDFAAFARDAAATGIWNNPAAAA